MTKKAKGPASVGALPDRGSITHPCMRKEEMNEVTNTTAPAVEQEMIGDKVDRLARELSEALPQWVNGQFMAMIYPAGDIRGYWFRNVRFDRDENGNATDPLVKIINDHNKAWSEYCAVDFGAAEEAGLKEIWKQPHDVLCHWDRPCSSKDGAIAAIKLAIDDIDTGEGPLAKTMLLAALGYLEGASA